MPAESVEVLQNCHGDALEVGARGRRRSRRPCRRRTCRARARRAPRRPLPRPRPRAPRRRRRRSARRAPVAGSPVARSTERSGFISVGSGFIPARTMISSPFETPASIPPARFVSRRRSAPISSCASDPNLSASAKPFADLDTLHRLDAHQRGGETGVEAVVLRRVAAEPGRNVARAHFDDPADRVPCSAGLVDAGAQRLLVDGRARDLDADRGQEGLGDRARGDVHRRVPRRRALERVADIAEVVLLDAGEVGVARTRKRHGLRAFSLRLALGRPRAHPPRPVLVVAVPDDERERRPEGAAVAQTGEHVDPVLLDLLPRRAAVALLPPLEVAVDRVAVEHEPGRQAGEDRDEPRAVRLARSGKPK